MLATLVGAPFDDPDWLFEVKWDGFRVEAVVDGGSVRLWTRGEKDAAGYFGPFLDAPGWIDARRAVVDGEVIALDERGEPDFALLQSRIKGRGAAPSRRRSSTRSSTSCISTAGSLLDEPLEERRRLLRGRAPRRIPRVRLSEHVESDGHRFLRGGPCPQPRGHHRKGPSLPVHPGQADRPLAEDRRSAPSRSSSWAAGVEGTGRAIELGALLVGVYEAGGLQYAGKVGVGFTNDVRAELLAVVAPLAATEQPFMTPPPRAAVRDAALAPPGACQSGPSSPVGPATASSVKRR